MKVGPEMLRRKLKWVEIPVLEVRKGLYMYLLVSVETLPYESLQGLSLIVI